MHCPGSGRSRFDAEQFVETRIAENIVDVTVDIDQLESGSIDHQALVGLEQNTQPRTGDVFQRRQPTREQGLQAGGRGEIGRGPGGIRPGRRI